MLDRSRSRGHTRAPTADTHTLALRPRRTFGATPCNTTAAADPSGNSDTPAPALVALALTPPRRTKSSRTKDTAPLTGHPHHTGGNRHRDRH